MKDKSKNFAVLLLISVSLLVNSCSTNHKKEKEDILKSDTQSADLVEVFDIEKKQAEEFRAKSSEVVVKSVGPVGTPVVVIPLEEKEAKDAAKQQTIIDTKKEVKAAKQGKGKIVVTPEAAPNAMPAVQAYPPGYPEEYKAYDDKSKLVWEKFKPMFCGRTVNHGNLVPWCDCRLHYDYFKRYGQS